MQPERTTHGPKSADRAVVSGVTLLDVGPEPAQQALYAYYLAHGHVVKVECLKLLLGFFFACRDNSSCFRMIFA